jgi:hypothetical protein
MELEFKKAAEAILAKAGSLVGGLGFACTWNLDESVEGFNKTESLDAAGELGEEIGTVVDMIEGT